MSGLATPNRLPCLVQNAILGCATDEGPAAPLIRRRGRNVRERGPLPSTTAKPHGNAFDEIRWHRLELVGEFNPPFLVELQGCQPVARESSPPSWP